jgi:hypothetical protein
VRIKLTRSSQRALALLGVGLLLCGTYAWAQNLGSAPQTNVAVQGQTGAQPEGAFLNFINWVGNVIARARPPFSFHYWPESRPKFGQHRASSTPNLLLECRFRST